jgi:hypothetical protein
MENMKRVHIWPEEGGLHLHTTGFELETFLEVLGSQHGLYTTELSLMVSYLDLFE